MLVPVPPLCAANTCARACTVSPLAHAVEANGVDIARAGGVALVAAALRRHADHAGVALAACNTLQNLSASGA